MQQTSVLFIGHDLKFINHIIDHFKSKVDYSVDVMTYPGHAFTPTENFQLKLPYFDIIFCEWGLGNLKWFSHNKYPGQKLVTRIHAQEFSTSYLAETRWENVDKIIFVGPAMMEKFTGLYPELSSKCQVVYNLIDTRSLNLEKEKECMFNLGLLGMLPKIKSPHLALEILLKLRKSDQRYKLYIKSKRPEELAWLWKRPEEQEYYAEFYNQVEKMGLQDAVIFEPHGNDVGEWFRKIGFILSTSESEAFHMSVAEGMASGAIPVIRNWEGAKALYPESLIFDNITGAVSLITDFSGYKLYDEKRNVLKEYATNHFSMDVLLPEYDKILTRDIDRNKMRKALNKLLVQQQEILQENNKLRSDLDSLQETNVKLKADLTSLQESNNKLKIDFTSLQEGNKKLKTDFTALQETNHKLLIDLTTNQESNNNLKIDIQKLIADLASQQESYKKLAGEFSMLKSELKETTRLYH
ncbi:MAG: glycosyltransferase, partial [Bacteroidales bacterium]|nr:glycosyltransferase [Bacteroidales bacterium]